MRKTEDVMLFYSPEDKREEKPNNDKIKEKKTLWHFVYEWLDSLVFAIILILLVFVFAVRIVGVVGESMLPTLNNGDWLTVSAINKSIDRGDIVVVTQPNNLNEPLIKRVIAVGGDIIDINRFNGEVTVNGEVIHEPYIAAPIMKMGDFKGPVKIPEGYVFVMGDNRNESLDSRFNEIGIIDERYILGVANSRIFPFGEREINSAGE